MTTSITPPLNVSERVHSLHARMTLEEKLAQLVGYWLDQNGVVAPMQSEMTSGIEARGGLSEVTKNGIGHYTRVYGTRPVDPQERAAWLWEEQRRLKRETRLGIPALVHEECLTGLAAWKAATFPTPLAWGASFDPELVEEMATAIGESMHQLGIHQGLAPVLDVVRDPRWGRVDECISEDPYLVGTIGTAYVRGLQSAGVHATLKHFLGYSGSQAGRNHAPVHAGPREIADIFLPPFEMAIHDGKARSVMNSYSDIDGIPMAAHTEYLTELLRKKIGFTGTVVADYFAVAFLEVMQAVAENEGEAAELALMAGIDVELPTGKTYLEPLAARIRSGLFDEAYVDRAVLRVLMQKEELGLLEKHSYEDDPPHTIDLDSPRHQELARRLAAESVILLANDGTLPLSRGKQRDVSKIAVIGPNAHQADALQGCYSFANHVLVSHPELPLGFRIPTLLESISEVYTEAGLTVPDLVYSPGCEVEGDDRGGFAEAVEAAASSDLAIIVVGDQAGLFGRGTVGEGNDSESLELPGVQRQLVQEILSTHTPVILVLLTGRPYAIDWALDGGDAPVPQAVLQAFFPGEGGGLAIADVIVGSVNPSGRLPVSMPRGVGAQPYSYLHPILGGPSEVTAADSTPLLPFGFGLSYTSFRYGKFIAEPSVVAGGVFSAAVSVANTGEERGTEVVQLYGHDVSASITRPVAQLLGYARVELDPGESARVTFSIPTTRFAFSDRTMKKIVEPGGVEVWCASHAAASPTRQNAAQASGNAITNLKKSVSKKLPSVSTPRIVVEITGDVYPVTPADPRIVTVQKLMEPQDSTSGRPVERAGIRP
ncbi:glycoside hydrolase family 3 N-terminal domain-containing protein [Lysinibacter sp. HNR]|uniref:beta-xylosidase/alpha-l-arabinosidase n=1 Tax=Lysinibacter sp. HNR TaxID=3031408 RepID=UPI00243513F9|nr:glycoside hydrolase family 3 N-terminal domain-containing protein [Lysinibacter sp. HNR]WGD37712.1 glycoside hydrolase family 3 N-terminal domain-containing protein [Lysinibacter sp. HNR]